MAETSRGLLERIYRAAVAGADPGACVRASLEAGEFTRQRTFIVALGKAAGPMASAARDFIAAPTLVVDTTNGDHPVPGTRSRKAADDLGNFLAQVEPGDRVLVLLSGGTSSLIAAPAGDFSQDDVARLFQLLLGSGLDIHAMNLIRKRFCRWGAGRLAARIPGARIQVLAISDVSSDRIESIGSGPCAPDPSTAAEVVALLKTHTLWDRVPESMKRAIPETPKPGDPVFDRVTHSIIANNRTAVDAAANCARQIGLTIDFGPELHGDAVTTGRAIAARAIRQAPGSCALYGGETTVNLDSSQGLGGRCQELALAAALELEQSPNVSLLAAGTDGRDGPTDAAGAIIDGKTASLIRESGIDPVRTLQEHFAYPALDRADALLRTGPTGTNVRDVVVTIRLDS